MPHAILWRDPADLRCAWRTPPHHHARICPGELLHMVLDFDPEMMAREVWGRDKVDDRLVTNHRFCRYRALCSPGGASGEGLVQEHSGAGLF